MAALPHSASPTDSLPIERPGTRYRQARALWLALEMLDPPPAPAPLESLADFAQTLTPIVVLRPGEGLLLEVRGSLKYFSGLAAIRERLTAELTRRGWTCRLATAPTPLAASWLVRCESVDIVDEGVLAGAIGRLPLAATAWPEEVQLMLGQMGLASIADCMRLPRAGFARRVGRARLDDLDRALGRKPDFREACAAPQTLCRVVEFADETIDRAAFVDALSGIVASFEQTLRLRQMQLREITLEFRHLRLEATRTRIRFVDPVHERKRILDPLLARIERLGLREPAIALSLSTSRLLPLEAHAPGLLPLSNAQAARAVPEYALVECLRGRFGTRQVHGIDWVAEHRPERAWCRWVDRPAAGTKPGSACPPHGRPLWLLPAPHRVRGQSPRDARGVSPASSAVHRFRAPAHNVGVAGSDSPRAPTVSLDYSDSRRCGTRLRHPRCVPAHEIGARGLSEPATPPLHPEGSDPGPERVESGWWDGVDVRRDYHVVIGAAGEKLWLYRDCLTREWYLHGIFG
jgi:protein ImuB